MSTSPSPSAPRITSGKLYRLIPNWYSHWDEHRRQPKDKAFRRDGEDGGISMLLASSIGIEGILEKLDQLHADDPLISRGFGICEFQTETLLQPPPLPPQAYRPRKAPPVREVYVEPRNDAVWGDAHVVVMGVNMGLREWIYELGKLGVVKPAESIITAPKLETPP